MTAAELMALSAKPLFEIGGHTVTHPNLSTLILAEQEQEYRLWLAFPRSDSRKANTLLFVSIWPEGARVTPQIVKAAGFDCAVTNEHRRRKAKVTIGLNCRVDRSLIGTRARCK